MPIWTSVTSFSDEVELRVATEADEPGVDVEGSSPTSVVCEPDESSESIKSRGAGGGFSSRPKVGSGADLTRKYVEMGAGPEYAMWNGMRCGIQRGAFSSLIAAILRAADEFAMVTMDADG